MDRHVDTGHEAGSIAVSMVAGSYGVKCQRERVRLETDGVAPVIIFPCKYIRANGRTGLP